METGKYQSELDGRVEVRTSSLFPLMIFTTQFFHKMSGVTALQIFHGVISTFINSFDETTFVFHSPTGAAPQFL